MNSRNKRADCKYEVTSFAFFRLTNKTNKERAKNVKSKTDNKTKRGWSLFRLWPEYCSFDFFFILTWPEQKKSNKKNLAVWRKRNGILALLVSCAAEKLPWPRQKVHFSEIENWTPLVQIAVVFFFFSPTTGQIFSLGVFGEKVRKRLKGKQKETREIRLFYFVLGESRSQKTKKLKPKKERYIYLQKKLS